MRPHSEDTDDFFQSEKLYRLVCAEYLFGGKKIRSGRRRVFRKVEDFAKICLKTFYLESNFSMQVSTNAAIFFCVFCF